MKPVISKHGSVYARLAYDIREYNKLESWFWIIRHLMIQAWRRLGWLCVDSHGLGLNPYFYPLYFTNNSNAPPACTQGIVGGRLNTLFGMDASSTGISERRFAGLLRKACLTFFNCSWGAKEIFFVSAMISRLVGIGRFQVLSMWLMVGSVSFWQRVQPFMWRPIFTSSVFWRAGHILACLLTSFYKGSSLSCDGQFLHHRFFDGLVIF